MRIIDIIVATSVLLACAPPFASLYAACLEHRTIACMRLSEIHAQHEKLNMTAEWYNAGMSGTEESGLRIVRVYASDGCALDAAVFSVGESEYRWYLGRKR